MVIRPENITHKEKQNEAHEKVISIIIHHRNDNEKNSEMLFITYKIIKTRIQNKDLEKLEPPCSSGKNVKNYAYFGKNR